jgi:CubicO group peptidase (beta-lactamase class C family)
LGAYFDRRLVQDTVAKVAQLSRVHSLLVAHDGKLIAAHVFRGHGLERPVNIRSASKAIVGALVGIAIERGLITSVQQPMLPLLKKRAPADLHPKVATISIDHLLTMRAGLERTTGWPHYDRWVQSPNWVSYALSRSFVAEPGGRMVYSTANMHLLSAILTDLSGVTTWDLAQRWLGKPLGIAIPPWRRDPQGIYLGGNDMRFPPGDLLRFGEMYRNGGLYRGRQVVPSNWIEASWAPRATDERGRNFGYGWFIASSRGHPVYYAWGLGGQVLCVSPTLKLSIVITCEHEPSMGSELQDHNYKVHELVTTGFMAAAMEIPRLPTH